MSLLTQAVAESSSATCAPAVASAIRKWRASGYLGSSETTQRLLAWWFDTDHEIDEQPFAFYEAQRESIESLIYVHEIMEARDNKTLLETFLPNPDVRLLQYGDFARYGVKMATGSGKTMVMALAIVWSYLNAVREPRRGSYATSFLLIAPNIIVFERLAGDFASGGIFARYPMIPPEYADLWSAVRCFMRGDLSDVASTGAVYLTNIQQLYDIPPKSTGRKKGGVPQPIAALMGPTASDTPDQRDDFDERIARRSAPCMVINDEAHHTHDEDSEWNRTIRRLRERLGPDRFMSQLDFSATPRFNDGTLFPWVVYDYPLRNAIQDGIVKQPIRGEISGVGEVQSDDASVRYQAYVTAAVNRWREYRDQLRPLDKKPVLFAMLQRSKDADAAGSYLQQTYPDDFGGDKLQVIHIGRDGEVSAKDLQKARVVVKNIDAGNSSINAVVSVMMLREGWDVRNVTVVLGLRPYTSKANILPEQAIGRGLRLMFPGEAGAGRGYAERVDIIGTDKFMEFVADLEKEEGMLREDPGEAGAGRGYAERVDIIGTDKFMEFVADLEKEEGIALVREDVERVPIVIVTIQPDTNKMDMDIAMPNISPIYQRKTDTREEIVNLDVNAIRIDNLPFSLQPQDDATFNYLGLDALTDETLVERQYKLRAPNTCGEVISHYAVRIGSETNLPAHFDVITDKLRQFFYL